MRPRLIVVALCILVAAVQARADFRVGDTVDQVFLVDGTKLEGTVIAAGIKAVVMVVKGEKEGEAKEVVIPNEKVERIVRGEPAKDTTSFKTDVVDGTKKVTGQGFREEETEPRAPAEEPKQGEKPKPAKLGDRNIERQLEKAMGSNPLVKRLVKQAGGVKQAAEMLKNNPQLMSRVGDYLESGGVQQGPGGRAPQPRGGGAQPRGGGSQRGQRERRPHRDKR